MEYHCVECKGRLDIAGRVILVGEHRRQRGLFAFHPEPGRYEYEVEERVAVEPGTFWEFICPVCRTNLTSPVDERFAHIRMSDGEHECVVLFSKVANEHSTFVSCSQGVEAYGSETSDYIELNIQRYYW